MPSSDEERTVEDHGAFPRALGWFFVGAGAVGLGGAAYFGLAWNDDHTRSVSHCSSGCDAIGRQAQTAAQKDTKDAEAAAAAGGSALLVGTVLVLTAPGPRIVLNGEAKIELAPMETANRGGLVVRGAW